MSISATAHTSRIQSVDHQRTASNAPSPGPAANQALLPAPKETTAVAVDDMSALFGLMAEQRDVGSSTEKNQIKADAQKRDVEMRKRFDALKKEAAARSGRGFFGSFGKLFGDIVKNVVTIKPGRVFTGTAQNLHDMGNSPKFWSDLAKGAAVVAKVAALVISAASVITGPGAVGGVAFAAAIISLVAMAEDQLKLMDKLGVDGGVATGVRMGVSVVTIAMGNGQALSNAASTASKGMQASAQASKAAVENASKLSKVINATTTTVKVLQPAAKATEGGSQAAVSVHTRNAENHRADGEEHGNAKDAAQRDLERHIQVSVEGMEDREKLMDLIQQTIAVRSQTTLSLAGAIGGRA